MRKSQVAGRLGPPETPGPWDPFLLTSLEEFRNNSKDLLLAFSDFPLDLCVLTTPFPSLGRSTLISAKMVKDGLCAFELHGDH